MESPGKVMMTSDLITQYMHTRDKRWVSECELIAHVGGDDKDIVIYTLGLLIAWGEICSVHTSTRYYKLLTPLRAEVDHVIDPV